MSAQADINQRGSEGMGISNPPRVACNPRTFGRPSRGAKAVVSCASKNKQRAQSEERSDLLTVEGARSKAMKRWPLRIYSMEPYQVTNA